jgi:hypothetical protein
MFRFLSFSKSTPAFAFNAKAAVQSRSISSFSRRLGLDRRQSIYVSEIDTKKLLDVLERRFGTDFDVHVGDFEDQKPSYC